ncbi:MAG: glutathione-disulfide reductase [Alphaproteobacteria bacterium]|nr:glutathione-disulfide reductase [Alphaproteobacteria bacterium]
MASKNNYDYDLVVIGAGSGGVRAARMSAGYGARVAIIEESKMGGTCVNLGCIPKKLMCYASHFQDDFIDAQGYGWVANNFVFDWPQFVKKRDQEISRLNQIYQNVLEKANVQIIQGRATLHDPHTVYVNNTKITSQIILIATGSVPKKLNFTGYEYTIVSDQIFYLDKIPKHMIIIGTGYIALEFASIFKNWGAQISVIARSDQILRTFDIDVQKFLLEEMKKKNINFYFNSNIKMIENHKNIYQVLLDNKNVLEADVILYAIGREPNTTHMNLAEIGIHLGKDKEIIVNDYGQSSIENIYAIGDCTNQSQLTPVAIKQGMAFADTVFGHNKWAVSYDNIPTAVFTNPAVASVGLTEKEAAAITKINIFKSQFRPLKHTISNRDEKVLVKLIVDQHTDKVLGAHMVGADAPEIIQSLAISIKMGITKKQFDETMPLHPTVAEEFVTLRQPV